MTPLIRLSAPRLVLVSVLIAATSVPARAATPAEQLATFSAAAAAPAQPMRGRQFFAATHGREWSCASCHGATPTAEGKPAGTGKPIGPLAPMSDPQRFSDTAKTEKWFRRNCNDVLGRECTPGEKADVLAWLMSLGK